LLQFRAQPQGFAGGTAHPPFGSLGPSRCPGQRSALPRPVLLFSQCHQLAASFIYELAGHIRGLIHVTHLLSVVLVDGRASAPAARQQNAEPACAETGQTRSALDDHG
jgi:hypothetical protein